jgi:hypothetical protein
MDPIWISRLNVVVASIVVTLGFWILWGDAPVLLTVAVALGIGGFLLWQASMPGEVWAWATLILGLESLAWPIVTMLQVRFSTAEPSDQQMGLILTAVLFGMFSSIFWLSFSWGLFKRGRRKAGETGAVQEATKR